MGNGILMQAWTCNVMKSTRHGNELLGMSIQCVTERGDSGNDNLAYLSGDDTKAR